MNKWLNCSALKILANVQDRKSITFYYRELNISGSATAHAINELSKKGLIHKQKKGREIRIELTEIGKIAQDQIWSLNRLLG